VAPTAISYANKTDNIVKVKSLVDDIIINWGDGKYALYLCPGTDKKESGALGLVLDLKSKLDPKSEKKLFYFYGKCNFPGILKNDRIIRANDMIEAQKIFPSYGLVFDVSVASEAAILEGGGRIFSAENEFQTAARWWFDEQP
jgi:hypothetical protein